MSKNQKSNKTTTKVTSTSRRSTPKSSTKPRKSAKSKATYRITNWHEYNDALVKRGSLTIWFSQEALDAWESHDKPAPGSKGGHPTTYSNLAIEKCLTLL